MEIVNKLPSEIFKAHNNILEKHLEKLFIFAGIKTKDNEGRLLPMEQIKQDMKENEIEIKIVCCDTPGRETLITLLQHGEVIKQDMLVTKFGRNKATMFIKKVK